MDLAIPSHRLPRLTSLVISTSIACFCMAFAHADDPLHLRIDEAMAEIHPGPENSLCSDGEFLRRVSLDLVGTIPSGAAARKFIADPTPDKRVRIVEELLASPDHAKHLAQVFDVMLMERRANKYVKADKWADFLLTSFQQDKPFNQLAREVLGADGVDEKERGAAKFFLEREVEPNLLTREVGRMFFGVDLQCAQCHDHPTIDDYYQSDYYGMFAFVNRSYLFQPDKKKPAVLAEKAEGETKFKSVFTDEEGSTLPRLPGAAEINEPTFAKEDAYKVKPDKKKKEVRPIPKFSRRHELAARATDGSNQAFNRNLANRLWAHMMGRGLVHPVDQHHSANPPIHPQLLEMLADELVKTDFHTKPMLRELALSRTYQRNMDLPQDFSKNADSARRLLERWKQQSKDFALSIQRSEADTSELEDKLQAAREGLPAMVIAAKNTSDSLATTKKAAEDAASAKTTAQQKLTSLQKAVDLIADAAMKSTEAAGILTDDASLADVVKTLQARHQASKAKASEHAKSVAALTTAEQVAVKKLAETQAAATVATQELNANKQAVAQIAKELAMSKQRMLFDQTTVSHAKRQITRLEIAIAYGDAVQRRDAARGETQKLVDQIASEQSKLTKLMPEVERLKNELPKAESKLAEAVASSARQGEQFASTKKAAELIAVAFAKADEAARILPDDSELVAAAEKLKGRSQILSDQSASLIMLVAQAKSREQKFASSVQAMSERASSASAGIAEAKKRTDALQKQLALKQQQLAELEQLSETQQDALKEAWSHQFSIAVIQPLSPEQLAWSMLRATGYIERQRKAIQTALEKKSPLKPEEKGDAAKVAAREKEIDKQTEAKLKGIVGRFVKLFGAASGQPQDDFFATVDQALFFGNGGELRNWLAPTGGNLTDRLQNTDDPKVLAEDLYSSILTRLPTTQETADVADYLSSPELKKRDAVQELAWALLTSAEFRFQH